VACLSIAHFHTELLLDPLKLNAEGVEEDPGEEPAEFVTKTDNEGLDAVILGDDGDDEVADEGACNVPLSRLSKLILVARCW